MNAIQTVRAIRHAEDTVKGWANSTLAEVSDHRPRIVIERGHTGWEWAITVELLRTEGEHPTTAAARIARYMTLHTERWDHTPTLKALTRRALRDAQDT